MNERLKRKVKPRSPDGVRRATTIEPKRNMLVVDLGEDQWGIRPLLDEMAKLEGRTVSSLVREILRTALLDS